MKAPTLKEQMFENFDLLTDSEINKLEKYVYSPYFTTQKSLVKLFRYLQSLRHNPDNPKADKKEISKFVFGKARYNDVNIRKLISDFNKLIESFMLQLSVDEMNKDGIIYLLQLLRKKGLRKRFELSYNEFEKRLNKAFSKDSTYYRTRTDLNNEFITYFGSESPDKFASVLQDKSDSIDLEFIFSKLHVFNEMRNSDGMPSKINLYKKNFQEEINFFIEENKKEIIGKHPNIFIIYLVNRMFESFDDKYLDELEKYLVKNEKLFEKSKLSYYYHYITQYYIGKISKGTQKYNLKLFPLYKKLKKKNLLLIDNNIKDNEFNSIVNTALILKEYEWLREFIEEYRNFLEFKNADVAYNLALAKIHFNKKEFGSIFPLLNSIDTKSPYYYTNLKFLMGKVYYETGNQEGAIYIINNLRQYIRMCSKLSPEQLEGIKNYNKYMTRLIKIPESDNKEKGSLKIIMKKELDNETKFVPNKAWFYEKLETL